MHHFRGALACVSIAALVGCSRSSVGTPLPDGMVQRPSAVASERTISADVPDGKTSPWKKPFYLGTSGYTPMLVGGLTSGPDGNLWFSDYGANVLGEVTTTGQVTTFLAGSTPLGRALPSGLQVSNNTVYAAENSGYGTVSSSGSVSAWDFACEGSCNYPYIREVTTLDLAVTGSGGTVTMGGLEYTSPSQQNYAIVQGVSTILTGIFPTAGYVDSVALGPDGNVWFTDEQACTVGKLVNGTVTEYPLPSCDPQTEKIPSSLAAGPDGNVWVFLSGAWLVAPLGNVVRVQTNGTIVDVLPGLSNAQDSNSLVLGPDNALWSGGSPDALVRQDASGALSTYDTKLKGGASQAITVGPDHNVWLTTGGGYLYSYDLHRVISATPARVTLKGSHAATIKVSETQYSGDFTSFVEGENGSTCFVTPRGPAKRFKVSSAPNAACVFGFNDQQKIGTAYVVAAPPSTRH
jgi:virginiamycin B lyase